MMQSSEGQLLEDALTGVFPGTARKREMICALCNNMRDYALQLAPFMPEDWDGHELRTLLAYLFSNETSPEMRDKRSRRYREYEEARMQMKDKWLDAQRRRADPR